LRGKIISTLPKTQADEILQRYGRIKRIMQVAVSEPDPLQRTLFTERLDDIFASPKMGLFYTAGCFISAFQSVFWLAQYPMDWIDSGFAKVNSVLSSVLPEAWWSNLLMHGLLAGLSGILVFVPQIMICLD
jgi:ferrous iron transport protein B